MASLRLEGITCNRFAAMRRGAWLVVVSLIATASCGGAEDDTERASDATTTTGASSTTAAASGEADIDELFDVVGHKLHLACMGSGSPTVLIEMGAGQRISAWNGTLPVFAEERRACVYERAATGDSEPGPEPRTSQVIADELAALVEAAGLQTPLIVVSHSLGGMHAQAFAQRHSDLVAGLVFVEPRTAEYQLGYSEHMTPEEVAFEERLAREAIAGEPFGPEIVAANDSAAAIESTGLLPDVPVVVLTAGVPFDGQSESDLAFWHATHENLAAQVTNGRTEIVDGADHEIWRTDTPVIAAAIDEVAGG